jgi:hypothetical protein
MKSAKGLFTSTGSPGRGETSSPEQLRGRPMSAMASVRHDHEEPQPRHISSPPRQEIRRTRSSTEKEEKRLQKEREDREEREEREQEEARHEKAQEQERLRAQQLKAAQDKSSVEPEERTSQKSTQSQRQQPRRPESAQETSKFSIPQLKQKRSSPQADSRAGPKTRAPACLDSCGKYTFSYAHALVFGFQRAGDECSRSHSDVQDECEEG